MRIYILFSDIECNRTIEVGLGSDLTVHCMLGNVDASYITNVTIYKNEILILSGGGTEGTENDDVNKASLTYNASSLRLEITGLTCNHAGRYRVIVNDLLKDDIVIVVKSRYNHCPVLRLKQKHILKEYNRN